jgi:Fic-DOC domain mobile mystery protein B
VNIACHPPGATPLDAEDLQGLRLPHLSTRSELDRWESENILVAEEWAWSRKRKNLMTETFLLELHKRMFGKVWKWAGRFRTSDKNLGVPYWDVAVKVRNLCEDGQMWIEKRSYAADEAAARLHHRLVSIHPFVNGNGRHARLWCDLVLAHAFDASRFTWGGGDLARLGTARARYLEALRAADNREFEPLLRFVRS